MVEDVLEFAQTELKYHNILVEKSFENRVPRISGNKVQLQQVLLNLVLNAIDAMDSTALRHRTLRIGVECADPGVLVTVEDSGPGIRAAELDQIFDPYFTTKSKGVGLGLWICRSIAEAHGGETVGARRNGARRRPPPPCFLSTRIRPNRRPSN